MTAATIAHALHGRKCGAGWTARCPAHPDKNPSLTINSDDDGRPLIFCHAGCKQEAVIAALRQRGLWPERDVALKIGGFRIAEIYTYTDSVGRDLYQIVRLEPKSFRQRYSDGAGGWIWKKHPQQVLYHLREVLENPIIFLVEGEKDVEMLRGHGFVGTCEAGGAKAPWLPQFTEALRGREVILIPDNDQPGRARVVRIARALLGQVARMRILELDGAKDISQWFAQGHSECELIHALDGESVAS
jgi:5S rRNA maturation endonuclease (ribonuclease M5)